MRFDLSVFGARARRTLTGLRRDEEGSMIIFGLLLTFAVLIFGGVAVDLMRVETTRTLAQGALDRGVLAAADVDQQRNPEQVVRDYLNRMGMEDLLGDDLEARQGYVHASVKAPTSMIFPGLPRKLEVSVASTAANTAGRAEVSLVLDMSGSMMTRTDCYHHFYYGWVCAGKTRLELLKEAAVPFVNQIVGPAPGGSVTVSLVPFSGSVSLGPELYAQLSADQDHTYSFCPDLGLSDLSQIAIPAGRHFRQIPHYQMSYSNSHSRNDMDRPVCPSAPGLQVLPFSSNRAELVARINGLVGQNKTSGGEGVKWGLWLLDPDSRDEVAALAASRTIPHPSGIGTQTVPGLVNAAHIGRPYEYDSSAYKSMVIISDGANTPRDQMANYVFDTPAKREYFSRVNFGWWTDYEARSIYTDTEHPLFHRMPYGARCPHPNSPRYYTWCNGYTGPFWYQFMSSIAYDAEEGTTKMIALCNEAKANGVEIFAVAVDYGANAPRSLAQCATSPTHFYDISANDLNRAFANIAGEIETTLRLIQ